jgi:hypothetical protein
MNNQKLFIGLFFTFIVFTIIGTISHEFGHYFAAKSLGYEAKINYAYAWREKANAHQVFSASDNLWFILGGPLETSLTGLIGLLLLFLFRKTYKNTPRLSLKQWLFIFLALFWLRPTTNLVTWIGGYLLSGEFSQRGDEIKLSQYLHIPQWAIITSTAFIGIAVLTIVIFKFVPVSQRKIFILAGLTGGIAGYIFWLVLFGKYIIP